MCLRCDYCEKHFEKRYLKKISEFQFCSRKCQNLSKKDGVLRKKTEDTNLRIYGQRYVIHTESARINRVKVEDQALQNRKLTMLKRYGVETPMQSLEIYSQIKKTTFDRHGVEYFSQSDLWKQKCEISSQEKYGVDWSSQAKEVKSKIESTNLEKYGVKCVLQSPEVIHKCLETKKLKSEIDPQYKEKISNKRFLTKKKKRYSLVFKTRKFRI
jgi:hypothetical protein